MAHNEHPSIITAEPIDEVNAQTAKKFRALAAEDPAYVLAHAEDFAHLPRDVEPILIHAVETALAQKDFDTLAEHAPLLASKSWMQRLLLPHMGTPAYDSINALLDKTRHETFAASGKPLATGKTFLHTARVVAEKAAKTKSGVHQG